SILANNPGYVRYGNAASEFTTPTLVDPAADPTTVSVVSAPAVDNPAFGIGASGSWAEVEGSSGAAQFRYEVNNSRYDTAGVVTIRATGKVGNSTRSLVADLKQNGFVEFVYFTNYETSDPYSDTSPCNNY